jgi:hypothetical protein
MCSFTAVHISVRTAVFEGWVVSKIDCVFPAGHHIMKAFALSEHDMMAVSTLQVVRLKGKYVADLSV